MPHAQRNILPFAPLRKMYASRYWPVIFRTSKVLSYGAVGEIAEFLILILEGVPLSVAPLSRWLGYLPIPAPVFARAPYRPV